MRDATRRPITVNRGQERAKICVWHAPKIAWLCRVVWVFWHVNARVDSIATKQKCAENVRRDTTVKTRIMRFYAPLTQSARRGPPQFQTVYVAADTTAKMTLVCVVPWVNSVQTNNTTFARVILTLQELGAQCPLRSASASPAMSDSTSPWPCTWKGFSCVGCAHLTHTASEAPYESVRRIQCLLFGARLFRTVFV